MDSEGTYQLQSSANDGSNDVNGDAKLEELLHRAYQSKDDIIEAVQDYHAHTMRNFREAASAKRHYKVVCTVPTCNFVAQYAFKSSFGRPPKLAPHSCSSDFSIQGRRSFCTTKFLVSHTDLREFFLANGRSVSPIMFKRKAGALGMYPTYQNCVNTCKKLMEEVFGSDYTQHHTLPPYVEELKKNGHKTVCDVVDGVFLRMAIVFREGIRSFSQYSERGMSIDGTLLKTLVGGTFLVGCFRNGNGELQIVGVAVVSIENQLGFFSTMFDKQSSWAPRVSDPRS